MKSLPWLLAGLALAGLPLIVEPAHGWLKSGPGAPNERHHRLRTPAVLDGGFGAPAAAAYSFRLLKSTYAGKAFRLRRASDNLELDIGFTAGGDFDTAAATAHCAATSCFVAKWYDQSGNARDAAQATAGLQPALIFNCNGAQPCARSTLNGQQVFTTSITWASVVTSLSAVGNRRAGIKACYFVRKNVNAFYSADGTANNWTVTDFTSGTFNVPATDNAWHAGIGIINGASSLARIDSTETAGSALTGAATVGAVQVVFNSDATATTTCDTAEAILWDGYALTAAERAALTANQKAYFGF